jgi:inosose dehydratase
VTDLAYRMAALLDQLGHEKTVGVNLDTGNCWLGGGDPLEFVRRFGPRIKHVHWKDLDASLTSRRGQVFGCGMGTIPLGDGVVGVRPVVDALLAAGFNGPTTLAVAGADAVKASADRLRAWAK